MCVIIDTNRIHSFFKNPKDKDCKPLRNWVEKKKGRIVYSTGGKFEKELDRGILLMLREYRQNKQATIIEVEVIEKEIRHLESDGVSKKSDDLHILALARVSGARLLYTADQNLIDDFKKKSIIDNPRGSVYSTAKNEDLLRPGICKPKT